MTIGAWINPDLSKPGHVVVIRPYDSSYPTSKDGVYIAQAGENNYTYASLGSGLGAKKQLNTKYYYHK